MPSGGKRQGSGRKSYNVSEREKKKLLSCARTIQKNTGMSVGDILMRMIYGKVSENIKLAALKLYYEIVTVKEGYQTVEKYDYGPTIGLPPLKEKPKEKDFFTPVERAN